MDTYLAERAGGARPADRELAARFTERAHDRLPSTRYLDIWHSRATALDHAMTGHGLGRDSTSAVRHIAHDPPLQQWLQTYTRRSDGTQLGVTITAAYHRLLITLTSHAVTATAAMVRSDDPTATARAIARAAARHLDGLHPGPAWNATGHDRDPVCGHPLWRATTPPSPTSPT